MALDEVAVVDEAQALAAWAKEGRAWLDVRPAEAFAEAHLSPSRHLPLAALEGRFFELPPRHCAVAVVHSGGDEGDRVLALLADRGWTDVRGLAAGPSLWAAAQRAQVPVAHGATPLRDQPVLFTPSLTLAQHVGRIETALGARPWRSLDMGCGAGRDVIHLARRGWEPLGVDCMQGALQRLEALAAHCGVTVRPPALCKAKGGVFSGDSAFASERFDLVMAVRFHEEAILPALGSLVRPGGFLLLETFAAEGCGRAHSPKPARLLSTAALEPFQQHFDTVTNALRELDDGRLLRCFVARRRPPAGSSSAARPADAVTDSPT